MIKFRSLAKKKTLWICLTIGLMFTLPAIDDGCGTHEPWSKRRPKNVPSLAFYVPTAKTYWYVHCWLDQADSVNRCRIYHSDGTIMYEDAYLPYQGTGPVPPERLEVSRKTGSNGPYVVYLRDGTILLTRSDFAHQKRFVDWILGKRKSPAEE